MPTTLPRYQVTDTGRTREMIDSAAREWPDLASNRKALLLKLAERGAEEVETRRREQLRDEVRQHVGEYVAILDDRVIASDKDVAVVVAWLKEHETPPDLIYLVPDGEIGDFGAHGLA